MKRQIIRESADYSCKKERFKRKYDLSESLQCYMLLSTQIIGFLLFVAYPLFWAFRWAWFYYDGNALKAVYVGWDNFVNIFTKDTAYWGTWITTFEYALKKLAIELPLAMLLALLLNKRLKGSGIYRNMLFLPHIVSVAIVGLIFSNMFSYFGIVNGTLMKYGFIGSGIDWFSNKPTAMAVLITGSVWSTLGINVLYFLAALQNVPEELYECAYLDGASRRTRFFKITLPMMAPVLQTVFLLALNGSLQVCDYVLVLTNGAPTGSTFTVMSYLVNQFVPGFSASSVNIGYGCAMSIVTSVIISVIAVIYLKCSRKMQNMY